MQILIIVIATIVTIILLSIVFQSYKVKKKEIEKIALKKELNELTEKYPENIQVCK